MKGLAKILGIGAFAFFGTGRANSQIYNSIRDFNGDRYTDILSVEDNTPIYNFSRGDTSNFNHAKDYVYDFYVRESDGKGGLSAVRKIFTTNEKIVPSAIVAEDVDGDGDTDILYAVDKSDAKDKWSHHMSDNSVDGTKFPKYAIKKLDNDGKGNFCHKTIWEGETDYLLNKIGIVNIQGDERKELILIGGQEDNYRGKIIETE